MGIGVGVGWGGKNKPRGGGVGRVWGGSNRHDPSVATLILLKKNTFRTFFSRRGSPVDQKLYKKDMHSSRRYQPKLVLLGVWG